jgi:hypothetical protein
MLREVKVLYGLAFVILLTGCAAGASTTVDGQVSVPTAIAAATPSSAAPAAALATSAPQLATTASKPRPARSKPTTSPPKAQSSAAAEPKNCDPAYPEVCLHDGIGDYDCAGGSGNGPNYVDGPVKVLAPDPFGLDRDGDGIGCQ